MGKWHAAEVDETFALCTLAAGHCISLVWLFWPSYDMLIDERKEHTRQVCKQSCSQVLFLPEGWRDRALGTSLVCKLVLANMTSQNYQPAASFTHANLYLPGNISRLIAPWSESTHFFIRNSCKIIENCGRSPILPRILWVAVVINN